MSALPAQMAQADAVKTLIAPVFAVNSVHEPVHESLRLLANADYATYPAEEELHEVSHERDSCHAVRWYASGRSRRESAPASAGRPCANERLTWLANMRQAPGVIASTGPVRFLVSRTSTRSPRPPTSTQSEPPLPLQLDLRQRGSTLSSTAVLPP